MACGKEKKKKTFHKSAPSQMLHCRLQDTKIEVILNPV